MPRKKNPNQTKTRGVPPKVIEWDRVDKYLMANMSGREVAVNLGMHEDTLYLRCLEEKGIVFSAYRQSMRDKGDSALRAVQYDEAVNKRNTKILMHCFKHRLGEMDIKEDSSLSPVQPQIDSDHENMSLKAQLRVLQEQIKLLVENADKSQAG